MAVISNVPRVESGNRFLFDYLFHFGNIDFWNIDGIVTPCHLGNGAGIFEKTDWRKGVVQSSKNKYPAEKRYRLE